MPWELPANPEDDTVIDWPPYDPSKRRTGTEAEPADPADETVVNGAPIDAHKVGRSGTAKR